MSQHSFPLPAPGIDPVQWYLHAQQQSGFEVDESQERAAMRLQQLFLSLLEFKRLRARPLGRAEILGHSLLPQPALPRGIYLWGGVGRGKSLLLDVFFSGLPYRRKQRMHFHAFMQEIHQQLQQLRGQADPLAMVATRIAVRVRVLCLDEFHINDIADAMIMARLLEYLFRRGVVMVLTSNYAPELLYPHGLQRAAFLPAIALLRKMLDVVNLDGRQDHRKRLLTLAPLYLVPADALNESRLAAAFADLAHNAHFTSPVWISGLSLPVKQRAEGVAWFDFDVLCGEQRSQVDYLFLARRYSTLIVSGIPLMGAADMDRIRRLIWLVDVLYDYRVKLIVSAAAPPEQLLQEGDPGEFLRTVSRLLEMQTQEYLQLAHEPSEWQEGIVET